MEGDLFTISLIITEFEGTSTNNYRSIEKQAALAIAWLNISDANCYYCGSN